MKISFSIEYRTLCGQTVWFVPEGCDPSRAVAMHYTGDGLWSLEAEFPDDAPVVYSYIVRTPEGLRREWGAPHRIDPVKGLSARRIRDSWSDRPGDAPFRSSAFTDGIFARPVRARAVHPSRGSLLLEAEAPALRPGERLAVCGECPALGGWDPAKAPVMSDAGYPIFRLAVRGRDLCVPCRYKFVVLTPGGEVLWERGDDRLLHAAPAGDESVELRGLRPGLPLRPWRGAGVAVPVFALRSEKSFGTGEFLDLKLLVDWAAATGQRVIQILPVNDTTMTGTWQDSYPYNANSTFALHPQYLRPEAVGLPADPATRARFGELGRELNALPEIDYERVNAAKRAYLRTVFDEQGAATLASKEYRAFFRRNREWLVPYAAFCTLRDRFSTPDFRAWGRYAVYDARRAAALVRGNPDAEFHCFLQYHLHRQLLEVRDYAHSRGVVLKGDIPIGISRTSADAWLSPGLFRMDSQAGAPPDSFSTLGQNWGFPTYDWERMAQDGFAWWQARFRKMAEYFDAYRIDHILGFFRIWEIPCHAIHGLLGHFQPALPFSRGELAEYGFRLDVVRHAEPYIRDWMLDELFGPWADRVRDKFLMAQGGRLVLRPEVATQRQIADLLPGDDPESLRIREGLLELADEVLFIEDPGRKGLFHPRISAQFTRSYRDLGEREKEAFNRLYDDFCYRRHNDFWYAAAMQRLPQLLAATRMLVCGEDLGMIPACVPAVMHGLQILSLEIQRMPKRPLEAFGRPSEYPYLSVCTTSTHDMTPIRAWWEEDRAATQRFYNEVLGHDGEAPLFCEPRICEQILAMHLASPAMLTILPLQDWLSVDGELRREKPQEERINVPAFSRYYWRYRMHLTLERLLAADGFNDRLRGLIAGSGRD